MSKTDKTAPWRVKTTYKSTYLVEQHDHRDGSCDLPARPHPKDRPHLWTSDGTRCYWAISTEFFCTGLARCGCAMCTGEIYEGSRRRRERRAGKRYAQRDWRNEY